MDVHQRKTLKSLAQNNRGLSQCDTAWREFIVREGEAAQNQWVQRFQTSATSRLAGTSAAATGKSKDLDLGAKYAYLSGKYTTNSYSFAPPVTMGNMWSDNKTRTKYTSQNSGNSSLREIENRLARMEVEVKKCRSDSLKLRDDVESIKGSIRTGRVFELKSRTYMKK